MQAFWVFVIAFIGWVVSVYRDDIKAFMAARCRSFVRARTADLMLVTRRTLGPYAEKHDVPDPMFRLNLRTLLGFAVALAFLWTPFLWIRWIGVAIFYWYSVRLFLVGGLLAFYRAKLVLRVIGRGGQSIVPGIINDP